MDIPLLTQGESKVYTALVKTGESSVGNILKTSGVSHSKIYDILQRLSNKGLVSVTLRNGRQYFSAANPSRLVDLIENENSRIEADRRRIMTLIPALQATADITHKKVSRSFEGISGMKEVLDTVLFGVRKGDEILILGSPKTVGERAGGYLREWQRQRIMKGAVCRIIVNKDAPSWNDTWWTQSKKRKLTFTKRSRYASPAYLVITKDMIATIYFSEVILSFLIVHSEVAKSYREFFSSIWQP